MNLPFGLSIEADFSGDGYLFLLLLILGSVFALLMNKPRQNSPSRFDYWLSWIIPAVRILALLLLLLLFFAPQLSLYRQYSIPKRLAVVVDQSRSMGKAWEGNIEDVKNSIDHTIERLKTNATVDIWTMRGQGISPGNLTFDDDASVFNWNPLTANDPEMRDIYSAVFLFSDGHLNGGRSPLDVAWSKTIGVNVVYPLTPKSNASLKIIDVSYLVSEGTDSEILIQGKLQQNGLFGRRATVQILSDLDQLLSEETIQLNQDFQEIKLPLRTMMNATTLVKIKAFIDGEEFLSEQMFEIIQDKTRKNVLIVSERINELHKFLVQSFSDITFQLHIIQGTQRAGSQTQTIIPENLDIIVLNDPGEQALEAISQTTLDNTVFSTIPSILFYDGIEELLPKWSEWLGVKGLRANVTTGPQTSFWSESSREHAFYLGLLGQGYAHGDIMEYATIDVQSYGITNEPNQLVMTGFGPATSSVFSLSDQPPRAIFSGKGIWKWFFHPQSKVSFEILWKYLLIYLEEIASFNPVQIDIPVQTFGTGAYIKAHVTIKDLDHRIIKAAELRAWQEDKHGEKTPLNLTRDEHGIYLTELDTKYPGEIKVIAEAYRFGELWGRDTSRIHLMNYNGEDQSRGVDEVFLSRLAARSGGQVIQIGENELPNMPVEMIQRESSYQFRGVHSPALFIILLVLLTFEWIWRRRNGLL